MNCLELLDSKLESNNSKQFMNFIIKLHREHVSSPMRYFATRATHFQP